MTRPAMERKLISLHVSPWSERAKWALDHHALGYEVVEHMPILGERRLRRLVGPGKPRATVPVLLAGDEVLTDSWDIAVYADREGGGAKLVPHDHEASIRAWTALADNAAEAGRALVIASVLASGPALDEQGPPFIPGALRPLFRPVTRVFARAFARKYQLRLDDADSLLPVIRSTLDRLRGGLATGLPYVQGAFGYADIVMATLLQGISPVDDRFWKIGSATRRAWTRPALAAEYADLIAWRDGIYERHRRRAASA